MKKFTLVCENSNEFDGWFADAGAIRQQTDRGILDCPYCGSTKVEKRLSAPNLSTPKTKARMTADQISRPTPESAPAQAPASVPPQSAALAGPPAGEGAAALRMAVRALHQKIQSDFTNVGDKFADEARRIHEGESEEQNIYGP
ncbi:MAG: DUF1178 family protein, partial [Pseudomonadota bacterium]|nr:DUF1178 family protein [Pseudomonadota bacterium]